MVGRVEFEEIIFTSWWLDELREEQREGKTVGFPYDRLYEVGLGVNSNNWVQSPEYFL